MLPSTREPRIGYVVKRYPRYSETFIVNEILAHERAGLNLAIFSQFGTVDAHFQDIIASVRAPVYYLRRSSPKSQLLWEQVHKAAQHLPNFWNKLNSTQKTDVRTLYQAVELALHVKCRSITHLHAHFATSAVAVAQLAAQFAEISYSFTAHAKDIFHQDVCLDDLRQKMRAARAVVTVSDYNLEYLRQVSPESQVVRVYNGLPLAAFPFCAPENRPPKIVAVGRLVEKKGFRYLLEACALLKKAGVSLSCDIIGTGELQETLLAQRHDLGLEDTVTLLGALPQREVKRRLQQAAVFAAPCVVGADNNQDGLPTVLLEAMALGTPCISTNVTGIPEILRHEDTGLMVAQRDSRALANAMCKLLTEPALQRRLAINARRVIEADFDSDINAHQLRSLITQQAVMS